MKKKGDHLPSLDFFTSQESLEIHKQRNGKALQLRK